VKSPAQGLFIQLMQIPDHHFNMLAQFGAVLTGTGAAIFATPSIAVGAVHAVGFGTAGVVAGEFYQPLISSSLLMPRRFCRCQCPGSRHGCQLRLLDCSEYRSGRQCSPFVELGYESCRCSVCHCGRCLCCCGSRGSAHLSLEEEDLSRWENILP
jgi:hypothetical protein